MREFVWDPTLASRLSVRFNVERITYGDDYEQRIGQSTLPALRRWNMVFRRSPEVTVEIQDFLRARKGLIPFYIEDPDRGGDVLVICEEFSKTLSENGRQELQAVFEEVRA